MTALAMIIGMIPMALGLGEGGEQNAPLGRAVIGGLLFATVSTLFFVPVLYAGVHQRLARRARAARRWLRRTPATCPRKADPHVATKVIRSSPSIRSTPEDGELLQRRQVARRMRIAPSWCCCCWRWARRARWSAG